MSEKEPKPIFPKSSTDQLSPLIREMAEQLVEGDENEPIVFHRGVRQTSVLDPVDAKEARDQKVKP